MLSHFLRSDKRLVWPVFIILILFTTLGVQAQAGITLTPGEPVTGTLNADTIAQVYTFVGSSTNPVTVVATSEDGLSLALLLTDASGNLVAQARDVNNIGETRLSATLGQNGTHFVTVLPVVGATTAEGTYEITLFTGDTPETTPEPETTTEPVATEAATTQPVLDIEQVVTSSGIQVSLSWNSSANLDLEVRDPVGGALFFDNPAIPSGGTFGVNVNGGCTALVTDSPTEQATWPAGGVPAGSYELLVYYQDDCQDIGPTNFTVSATVDGVSLAPIQGVLLPGQVYISRFEVSDDGFEMSAVNGIRGEEELPASAAVLVSAAQPITLNSVVEGTITNEQPYQSYSFEATANSAITLTMDATSGSLDAYLIVLDPTGNLIYFNDDVAQGNTNAALNNSVLPIAGTYTLVASRYGLAIGGTEGNYTLTLGAGASTGVAPVGVTPSTNVQDVPESVTSLQLPEGSIEITLVWNSLADLQLLVRDPAGDSVYDDIPSIRSGGRLGAAGNVNCTGTTNSPVSYVYWPANIVPRAGSYEVDIWFQNECGDATPVNFTVYVSVGGTPILSRSVSSAQQFLQGEHFITSFTINPDGTVIEGEGGITGLDTLNWEDELASAPNIANNETVRSSIGPTNKFDIYTFNGLAGDVVSIAMTAAAGSSLDTNLYLIGPNGAVVTQNDDAVAGENTNSLINNFTLPEDGQYTIIATHYGEQYGISSGAYTLTLSR